jgi:23S rRNA-/tRNA-specific pseudouridylate synthase
MAAGPVIKLSHPESRQFWEIPVLYEDEHVLAIDKPAGLALTASQETPESPNLLTLLHEGIAKRKPWATERNLSFLKHTYPLDTEIGGVLLFAKSKEAHSKLSEQFGTEKPRHVFLALVQGTPLQNQFIVEGAIATDPVRAGIMRVDPQRGKKARTECELLETFERQSLVRCRIFGFRPQQARVHLRYARHTVVGDRPYFGKLLMLSTLKRPYRLKPNHEERPLVSTPAIFSEQLTFSHPVNESEISVTAVMPKMMAVALKYLRRYQAHGGGSRQETAPTEAGNKAATGEPDEDPTQSE